MPTTSEWESELRSSRKGRGLCLLVQTACTDKQSIKWSASSEVEQVACNCCFQSLLTRAGSLSIITASPSLYLLITLERFSWHTYLGTQWYQLLAGSATSYVPVPLKCENWLWVWEPGVPHLVLPRAGWVTLGDYSPFLNLSFSIYPRRLRLVVQPSSSMNW